MKSKVNSRTLLNSIILKDLSLYGAEFTLDGHGDSACLLVHGLGCGPLQMRELAENLCKWGFTARGILLPGHCENTGDVALCSPYDWERKVELEYQQLKNRYRHVIVIGFSLGALLTLQLAAKYPIEKIVLMGTPIFMVREYLPIDNLINVCKIFIKRIKTWRRRCYMESEGYTGYLFQPIDIYYSLQVLYEISEIARVMKSGLKDVLSPTLIIHSKKDFIAAPASARYLMEHLGTSNKRLIYLHKSHHLMMYSTEKCIVFDTIKEFVK